MLVRPEKLFVLAACDAALPATCASRHESRPLRSTSRLALGHRRTPASNKSSACLSMDENMPKLSTMTANDRSAAHGMCGDYGAN
jgi:hypothetical protein